MVDGPMNTSTVRRARPTTLSFRAQPIPMSIGMAANGRRALSLARSLDPDVHRDSG